jgi:hypothetical protein
LKQHFDALSDFGRKYCRKIRFGWASALETSIVSGFGRNVEDAPFLGLLGTAGKANKTYKKKLTDADQFGFFGLETDPRIGRWFVVGVTFGLVCVYLVGVAWFFVFHSGWVNVSEKSG